MRASRKQRLELLQGLIDTDGSHNRKRNQCVFTSTDKALAYQVEELAASLGWKSYTCSHTARGFGVTTTGYQVMFTPVGDNPFKLRRKAALVKPKKVAGATYRIVQEVEPVLSVPTKFIDVDSPDHLYLVTEQFIPTHNCLGDTSRAKLIAKGPKRVYYVQLLLYRRGYQNLGLPVNRIVLLAWPRTKSSLDDLYVWEHVPTPEDEVLVDKVIEQTKHRQQIAELVQAGHLNIMDVKPTPSDDS